MPPDAIGDDLRSVWKGHLRFSLVSIPVKAVSARSPDQRPGLSWLHKDCFQPIRQKKTCPVHGEVRPDEVVSGYKLGKDRYVPLDEAELQSLRATKDDTVHVEAFVEAGRFDPVYL